MAEYNGWANYETWTVNLFITNESNECIDDATAAASQDSYGDALKDFVYEYFCTDTETGGYLAGNLFVQQALLGFMGEVDWKELRDHLVHDYAEGE